MRRSFETEVRSRDVVRVEDRALELNKCSYETETRAFEFTLLSASLDGSQGFVKSFHFSSAGWWGGTTATVLPGKKIAIGTSKITNLTSRTDLMPQSVHVTSTV